MSVNIQKDFDKIFLTNRDESGREIITFIETGKKYYVEWIQPRNLSDVNWGDVDPVTKKITGSYGKKHNGTIEEKNSLITKENGFNEISYGSGSPYSTIVDMHEKWKLKNK